MFCSLRLRFHKRKKVFTLCVKKKKRNLYIFLYMYMYKVDNWQMISDRVRASHRGSLSDVMMWRTLLWMTECWKIAQQFKNKPERFILPFTVTSSSLRMEDRNWTEALMQFVECPKTPFLMNWHYMKFESGLHWSELDKLNCIGPDCIGIVLNWPVLNVFSV